MKVQAFAFEHLDEVVKLHLQAFPNFFLCFLGPRFLREFYSSFLWDPQGLAYVAQEIDGRIVGAIVGPLDPRGYFMRLLKRRWWAFSLASLKPALQRPTNAPRIFRALFYRGESPPGPVRALVSSIAVLPEARGRGIGRQLVFRWMEEARRRGATGCYLITDADRNEKVNAFYVSLNWKLEHTYSTPEGRKMNRYIFDFLPPGHETRQRCFAASQGRIFLEPHS